MEDHTRYMRHAIALAKRHQGRTGANPSVGCVIVKKGKIIGRGVTALGGRPHGELEALNMAGMEAKGSTVYVTLEPCAHEDRTPSCAKILASSHVSSVITALTDPDPRTAGKGHQILRDAGIEVIPDILSREAKDPIQGFLSRITKNRPFYQLKLAITEDNKIAEKRGFPSEVTSYDSRRFAMLQRSQSDGILIGIGTALADDPHLTVRINGLEKTSPTRIILDPQGKLPLESRLVQTSDLTPVILVCDEANFEEVHKKYLDTSVDILGSSMIDGGIDLTHLSAQLAGKGIGRVMIEGGAKIASSFINADLIDEIALYQSDKIFGEEALDALESTQLSDILKKYCVCETFSLGADTFTLYQKPIKGH